MKTKLPAGFSTAAGYRPAKPRKPRPGERNRLPWHSYDDEAMARTRRLIERNIRQHERDRDRAATPEAAAEYELRIARDSPHLADADAEQSWRDYEARVQQARQQAETQSVQPETELAPGG